MNYIVLDLEWNQSADGKAYTNSRIPFEIIQIGAVKLDENFSEISQFDRYIRPAVYTKLHDKVQEILNVTIEELTCIGHDFTYVANDFIRWCGDDYIFCTWGQTDLTELQRDANKLYQYSPKQTLNIMQHFFSMTYRSSTAYAFRIARNEPP